MKRLFIFEAKHEKHVGSQCHLQLLLMNYISSGILWWIFFQTEIFAGFSLHIIHRKEQRNCDSRGHYIF
jgi:hypothetical protein